VREAARSAHCSESQHQRVTIWHEFGLCGRSAPQRLPRLYQFLNRPGGSPASSLTDGNTRLDKIPETGSAHGRELALKLVNLFTRGHHIVRLLYQGSIARLFVRLPVELAAKETDQRNDEDDE
jgi:hypothetical protein